MFVWVLQDYLQTNSFMKKNNNETNTEDEASKLWSFTNKKLYKYIYYYISSVFLFYYIYIYRVVPGQGAGGVLAPEKNWMKSFKK